MQGAAAAGGGSGGGGGGGIEEEVVEPRDAKIVKSLLKSMGVHEYEPRVVNLLLDFWYRYAAEVLTDAQSYSEHASKPTIDCDDLKIAIQAKVNFSFSQPPPREVMLELAKNRNKMPLPKSAGGPGIPLPPEQDILISPNYQLALPKPISNQVEETEEEEESDKLTSANTNPTQDQQRTMEQQQQQTPQRVSFPLTGNRTR